MQINVRILLLVAVTWWALLSGSPLTFAADPVVVARPASLVVDQARVLTDAERKALAVRLSDIQGSGRAQICILIASGTGDEALASYALRVAESWKLGRQDFDNGLLILIVPSKGLARIEVGYGLEGDIPDLRAAIFVRDYLQSVQSAGVPRALNALLDRIVDALPPDTGLPRGLARFVARHAEWKLPILMVILSLFTLLPLLIAAGFGRTWPSAGTVVAALVSAGLFASVLGLAAGTFWDSRFIGWESAAFAFPLPLLWSLNAGDADRMGALARSGRVIGNLGLFGYIFAALTIVTGAAMYVEQVRQLWIAPLFAVLLALAPLAFLLGGRAGAALMKLIGYYMFFGVALAATYVALTGVLRHPAPTAVTVAAVFAALIAIGLTLDDRVPGPRRGGLRRSWAWVFSAAAVLFILPFILVALLHAMTGDAFSTHFAMVMAGDGSFSQFLWWASGALGGSALLIGLGGKFGGGGASS